MDDVGMLAGVEGLLLTAAQIKDKLAKTGLSPVFNQQTSKLEPFDVKSANEDTIALLNDIEYFAVHNSYLRLAGLAVNQLQKNGNRLTLNACLIWDGKKFITAINPVITSKTGITVRNREGCLTWPGKKVVAIRHDCIEVEYINPFGMEPTKRKVEGYEAIIWQHEVDHLNGVLEELEEPLKAGVKIGPNEPCCCGSKKKYKKCHGR